MDNIARKIVCYNQGELVEYLYLSSIFHRDLREKVQDEEASEKIDKSLNSLIDYLNVHLQIITRQNFSILSDYFSGREATEPVISLYAFSEDEIIEILSSNHSRGKSSFKVEEHAGFDNIVKNENATCYFCNDILCEAKRGDYYHPFLMSEEISKCFELSQMDKNQDSGDAWDLCWKNGNGQSSPFVHRSSLIIPMTLRNNDLSEVYIKLNHMEGVERTIFGFLAFEHAATGFFDEVDIDVGYIAADLISIYMINRLNYTIYSKTFRKAVESIERSKK